MTTICSHCGESVVAGEEFCGQCGAYLAWERTTTGPPASARSSASGSGPPPAPRPPALPPDASAPPVWAPPREVRPTWNAASTTGERVPATVPAAPADPSLAEPPQAEASRADPGPTPAPAPEAAARRPAAPVPAARPRRTVESLDMPLRPGDRVCGACGNGNLPTRRFCRRCGASLVDATTVPTPGWWHRMWHRERVPVSAGARPGTRRRRRWPVKRLVALLLVMVLAGLGWGQRSRLADLSQTALDRVSSTAEVNPDTITATSEDPDHPAAAARDGVTNNFWAPARDGDPTQQSITATFAPAFRLVVIRVFNGAATDQATYLQFARAGSLTVHVHRSSGADVVKTVELADQPGAQDFGFGVDDVVSVQLRIASVDGAVNGALVALGELEFLRRS